MTLDEYNERESIQNIFIAPCVSHPQLRLKEPLAYFNADFFAKEVSESQSFFF
jgi:hypothetical protein